MHEFEGSCGVVFVPEQLCIGLIAASVASALAVDELREGEMWREVVRECVAHAEDVGVELQAASKVVDVERCMVHGVT